jgi:hypothetical protein
MRRFDLERERSSGAMWGWAAAIFALIVVMALVIGYNRSGTVATNMPNGQNAPSTTGAAPPTPRTPADQAAPTTTQPPASKPAESQPAPAPAPDQKQP